MIERLRRAARVGDGDEKATFALLRISLRQNNAPLLAETLSLWRSIDAVAVAEWLVSDDAQVMWPLRDALLSAAKKHHPMLAADVHDLFGKSAPFALISPGKFLMSSPEEELGRIGDQEQREVEITRHFLLGKTPLTQGQWQKMMDSNPSHHRGREHPVEWVNWYDAVAYCNALSELHGIESAYLLSEEENLPGACSEEDYRAAFRAKVEWRREGGYRLPTPAEWEYACRAGSTSATYNGTSGMDQERFDSRALSSEFPPHPFSLGWFDPILDPIAWFAGNSENQSHPVGQKRANEWGLFDMLGNVSEWCWGWDQDSEQEQLPEHLRSSTHWEDSSLLSQEGRRAVKGGGYTEFAWSIRAASHFNNPPLHGYPDTGFRCTRSLSI